MCHVPCWTRCPSPCSLPCCKGSSALVLYFSSLKGATRDLLPHQIQITDLQKNVLNIPACAEGGARLHHGIQGAAV